MSRQIIWKSASSVILFNTHLRLVLMLRRGSGAKFMPNSFVFPGGILDQSDLHFPRDKTDFAECGQSPIRLGFDDDFGLRVCAVRELFEEVGLLPVMEGNGGGTKYVLANADEDAHLAEWRKKIMTEPELFSRLFHNRFKMAVSSLIPWSNWLTPLHIHPTQRFNTAFFLLPMATLKLPTNIVHCSREMVEAKWTEPSQIIQRNANGEVSLPPPQFYELSRIQTIECFENDKIRNMANPRRITPHVFHCEGSEWKVNVLPGDYLYDETNADFKPPVLAQEKELYPPYSAEDETKSMHRIIIFHSESNQLQYLKLKLFVKNIDISCTSPVFNY